MTSLKNYKSKKVSNQYTRYFDIKKLMPRAKKNYRTTELTQEIEPQNKQLARTQTRHLSGRYATTLHWQPLHDEVANDPRGSPYMLVSEDDTLLNTAGTINRRTKPTCHNVLHEPRLRLDAPTGVEPLVRGIRLSICVEHTRFPLIGRVSKNMGLTHVPEHRLWNVQWCDNTPHFDLLKSMKRFQQINHFPGMSEICRKDLLSRNLNRMLKLYPGDYRIFPKTWLLPTDTYDVAIYSNKHKHTFILKPYSAGQGRGIWLTNNLRTVGRQEKLICQTYVDKPLLIDGYKFDLRVYTLVTSVDPLRIFVYNEGLARFATQKYKSPALGNSNNIFMHLTNYCVNRRNSNYDAGSGNDGGSKRKLSAFNKWLLTHNYNVEEFWATVDDAIIKTVISAWPVLKHNYHLCFPRHDKIQACFQLLGFDILVDWKLKPYILEVNHTPSLSGGEQVDNEVKRPLIRDTLNLISTPLVDKEEIIREDRAQLRDRLMNRRRMVPPEKAALEQRAAGGEDGAQACSLGALAQQIAWEESHLGNYRRIMPPTDSERVSYYFKFYNQYKEVSMFKDANVIKCRQRLNREHLKQQKLQTQLEAEQDQLRNLRVRKQKLQQIFLENSKQNYTALLRQKRAKALALARDMHLQKALLLEQGVDKAAAGTWQLINTQNGDNKQLQPQQPQQPQQQQQHQRALHQQLLQHIHQTSTEPTKSPKELGKRKKTVRLRRKPPIVRPASPQVQVKGSLTIVKARRRSQRRQLQCRARRARRLEKESRLDAEFLAKHSVVSKAIAGTRLPAGSSNVVLVSSSKSGSLHKQQQNLPLQQLSNLKPNRVNANAELKAKLRPVKKFKAKAKLSKQRTAEDCQREQQLRGWLPEPIFEADKQLQVEWRSQRTAAVNNWQFKELLFHEMYDRGHLTKNDIKQFPNLLYGILRSEIGKHQERHCNQREE